MKRAFDKPGNFLYPVPLAMVSCARPGEKPNIITIAWTGTINSDPTMLSISVRKDRYSHAIISETGEFVVNLTSLKLVRAADLCGVRSGRDIDKFEACSLTPSESREVKAPGIAEAPVSLECRVRQVIELGSHDMFLADILCVQVEDRYFDKSGRFHMEQADLVAFCHGRYYSLGEEEGGFGYSVRKKAARPAAANAAPKTKRPAAKAAGSGQKASKKR